MTSNCISRLTRSRTIFRTQTIDGKYAYVWGEDWGGLAVLDISDPSRPLRVGGNSALTSFYGSIAVSGNHVFVPGRGLTILDSFRPLRLQLLLGIDSSMLRLRLEGPRGVSVRLERSTNLTDWEGWQQVMLDDVPM